MPSIGAQRRWELALRTPLTAAASSQRTADEAMYPLQDSEQGDDQETTHKLDEVPLLGRCGEILGPATTPCGSLTAFAVRAGKRPIDVCRCGGERHHRDLLHALRNNLYRLPFLLDERCKSVQVSRLDHARC